MTVQQLINELMEIEDRTLPVRVYMSDWDDWSPAYVNEYDNFIGLG